MNCKPGLFRAWLLAGAMLGQAPHAPAATAREAREIRFRVTLTDGSALLGRPMLSSFELQTQFVPIQASFERIKRMKMERDKKSVRIWFTNGDVLRGGIDFETLEWETLAGTIPLAPKVIRTLERTPANGLADDEPDSGQPVALWPFDDGKGRDESDGGHDARVVMATPTEDRDGVPDSALLFDGKQTYLETPDDPALHFGSRPFSISLWFKTSAETRSEGLSRDDILAKGDPTISGFAVSLEMNKLTFFNGSSRAAIGGTVVNDGKWHHAVATRGSGGGRLYLDGKLDMGRTEGVGGVNVDTSYPLRIGRHGLGTENYFDGPIDDIAIYSRELSAGEVEDLYGGN